MVNQCNCIGKNGNFRIETLKILSYTGMECSDFSLPTASRYIFYPKNRVPKFKNALKRVFWKRAEGTFPH